MSFLDNLEWRHATKEFDTNKPVSEENLNKILKAIKMAPTSYGLQALHVYVVENLETRKKIKEHSYGQAQADTSTYLLIFCARTDAEQRVDSMIDYLADGDQVKLKKLAGRRDMMKSSMTNKSAVDLLNWSARQVYIALGFAMAAAAELKVDSCPMEGFVNEEIDKILNLPSHLKSMAYLALGNRLKDPEKPKFRFPDKDLFTRI